MITVRSDSKTLPRLRSRTSRRVFCSEPVGFTLPEVLVASVVLVVATVGAIVAFNVITQSVRGTGIRADQNRVIDQDIANINRISEEFTSCVTPSGARPAIPATHCSGDDVDFNNSFYYFPEIPDPDDSTTWTNANAFRTACQGGALRTNFISAIGGEATLADNVTRQLPAAIAGSNYRVRVTWIDQSRADRELRSIEIAPLVSAWCP